MNPSRRFRAPLIGALAIILSAFVQAAPATAPVADAAMAKDRDAVRRLLREGADVNSAQGDGMTALHWAALNDDAELVSTLLYAGGGGFGACKGGDPIGDDDEPVHGLRRGRLRRPPPRSC